MKTNFRKDYSKKEFHLSSNNPIQQFELWFKAAKKSGIIEPNAAILATASKYAIPSARAVLIKHFDDNGFVFFTNYKSRKAIELLDNPNAALVFYWDKLERQVRIEGRVRKIERSISELYFASRPRGAQLAALLSAQSKPIKSHQDLKARLNQLEKHYKDQSIPCPKHWGGYCVTPSSIEFWQGCQDRLHIRYRFTLLKNKTANKKRWTIEQLSP